MKKTFFKTEKNAQGSVRKMLSFGSLSAIMTFCGLLFFACNKECRVEEKLYPEDPRTAQEFGVSTDGQLLIFETEERYEYAVNLDDETIQQKIFLQIVRNFGFQNYFSVRNEQQIEMSKADSLPMDEYLGKILNVDAAIQIENHIYKIDLPNDKVYVLQAEYKDTDYQDLITGNTSNSRIWEYSTDDDVLDEVKDRRNGIAKKKGCGGVGGGTYYAHDAPNAVVVRTYNNGATLRVNPYVKFFRTGIWFKLSIGYDANVFNPNSNVKYHKATTAELVNDPHLESIELHVKNNGWWRVRPCKKNSEGGLPAGKFYAVNFYGRQQKIESWSRNLNGYHLFVRAKAKYNTTPFTYSSYSGYGGRNINSPY